MHHCRAWPGALRWRPAAVPWLSARLERIKLVRLMDSMLGDERDASNVVSGGSCCVVDSGSDRLDRMDPGGWTEWRASPGRAAEPDVDQTEGCVESCLQPT